MVKINFNLRTHKTKKATPIVMRLRWGGYDLKYPTLLGVVPKLWDKDRQRVRKTNLQPLHGLINKSLDILEQQAQKVYLDFTATGETPQPKALKEKLDFETKRKRIAKTDFWEWTNNFISESPKRINPKTGRVISHRTIQVYNTTFGYFKEFEKTIKQKIDFDNIEISTLKDFRDFLTTEKGFALNNVAKHIDTLRHFLRSAELEKITINSDVLNPKIFTILRETPHDIYLTETELQKIYNIDFSDKTQYLTLSAKDNPIKVSFETLDKARDLFLIGCYTGLRVSDYNNIKQHNIKNDYIDIYQTKTGQRVVIPIFPTVRQILDKYNGKAPPQISDQKLNFYIKGICRYAGITETIEKQQTKGGLKQSNLYDKCDLVTTHTARRSFATNMTKQGYPIQQIMTITGHKKESVFLKYVKLNPLEHAEIIHKQMVAEMVKK